ncbi:hypothetical protein K1719_028250 [Acacia pycnantha]|nr:hypothetical protein K1719_028250 [Acacia pycnantha]
METCRYERLQNYCYDCGCIGHEARNCKSQLDGADAEETEVRYGNGLGISYVKTIEEVLVAYDRTWDESTILREKPPSTAAGQPASRRTIGVVPIYGNNQDQGNNPAMSPPRHKVLFNVFGGIDESLMVSNHSEPRITELPPSAVPMVHNPLPLPQSMLITKGDETAGPDLRVDDAANGQAITAEIALGCKYSETMVMVSPHLTGPLSQSLHSRSYTSAVASSIPNQDPHPTIMTHVTATSLESSSLIKSQKYLVESPPSVQEIEATIIPHAGLSPLSAVTSGLNRIQLKRPKDHLEMERSPIPLKRRLLYLEPAQEALNSTSNTRYIGE